MATVANELEELLDGFVDELLAVVGSMQEAAQPFASVKLSPEEQMQRYLEINTPEKWGQVVRERGWNEAIDYSVSMERRQKQESENAPEQSDLTTVA